MPTLFPEDYEKTSVGKKRMLAKHFKKDVEFTALSIAFHAHEIYDYLKQQGIENPNSMFVEAFQYASTALGVPYKVIDEAFWTQTPLTEKALFDVSKTFNPNAFILPEEDLPKIPITIDFYKTILELFNQLPVSFWQSFQKEENFSEKDIQSYDLEALLQSFIQEVWLKTKADLSNKKRPTFDEASQMFLAYFYSNDQKHYRKETQELLLDCFKNYLEKQPIDSFKIDEKLVSLLDESDPKKIALYVMNHLYDWTSKKNYIRFLKSINKTKNLSLMNQLLLLYQRPEGQETKEVHDWIRENHTLKEEAKPIFLFGKNSHEIDYETGEIIKSRRLIFSGHEKLPIVPYFEKEDTVGREEVKKGQPNLAELFVTIENSIEEKIVFEAIEKSTFDSFTIRLKTQQTEIKTIQDLISCIIEKEKNVQEDLVKLENQSVVNVLLMNFGLKTIPIDFDTLENLTTLEKREIKIQELLTQVVYRSEVFLEKLEQQLIKEEPIKIRPTLDEEIRCAKELQGIAMSHVATEKENKKEKKKDSASELGDYLKRIKEKSDGSNQGTSS